MNERIKELMVQVCKEQGLPFTVEHNHAYMLDNFSEKFAELIVQECIEQVITGPNGPAHYAVEAALRLKKHFGVEE
jgi:hypothetical protein